KQIPYMFVEAESRRIGRILLPDFIMEAKDKGFHLLITASLDMRVERIYEDYIG
ncbi:MAG TPA: tRNA 2-selenouridine synthase, partial [Paenibacillaceae bacterium]|nr:tRNA 2-selenouridine synthase [Paenibacillaceae bacterium]